MSFIWSDTGKKVAVALKCYPWLLFCLSCSDFSILAVTAFPKSLCFISKHRQFLHKICIALIAFFWLFNWSSLKMDAQEQWSSLGRLCIFSAVWNGKEAGGISEISFFSPFLSFLCHKKVLGLQASQLCVFLRAVVLRCLLRCRAWFCVTCITWSVGEQGFVWEVVPNWGRGQWTNLSACCVGVSCSELAVYFKLDPPVVPDLCVLTHRSLLCVCPGPAMP